MTEVLVPIDKAGRVVLPKNIRDELAIHPGDLLKVSIQGDEVLLQPKKETAGFVSKGRALIFSSGTDTLLRRETVEEILASTREGHSTAITRGPVSRKRKQ